MATTHMPNILVTDILFGESPCWHEGRLGFSDREAHEILAVDLDGTSSVVARVRFPSSPMCLD